MTARTAGAAVSQTRKLCCNSALYNAEVTPEGMSESKVERQCTAIQAYQSQHLFAVVLLNSPASGAWEFEEYLRLLRAYHATQRTAQPGALPYCFFICADGAYKALQHYVHMSTNNTTCSRVDLARSKNAVMMEATVPLCDVIIGDMDSFPNFDSVVGTAADKTAVDGDEYEYHGWFDTVEAIADDVIDRIRAPMEYGSDDQANAAARQHRRPVLLPIACQMTTDFEKCLLLLQRLQTNVEVHIEDDVHTKELATGTLAAVQANRQALATLQTAYASAIKQTNVSSSESSAQDERQAWYEEQLRCDSLLNECLEAQQHTGEVGDSARPQLRTVVLPNVAVFGALGGRVDHEMAVMSCIVKFATRFHVMVTNRENVLFACWPNGITQWLTGKTVAPPQSVTQRDEDGATCGIIPFGVVREMETTGLQWNIVNGRPDKCDKVTQTQGVHFGFDGVISTCNITTADVVTVDLRRLHESTRTKDESTANPPTLISCVRQSVNALPSHQNK